LSNDSKNMGSIVERYSKALLELSIESKVIDEVHQDVQKIIELLSESNDLKRIIMSPIMSRNDQKVILQNVLTKVSVSKLVLKFLMVICVNGRAFIIERICKKFIEMEKDYKGEVRAEIISTEIPNKDDLIRIEKIIKESIGSDVSLVSKIDKSIIGGYILNIGSVMLDGSIRSKLQTLKVSMKGTK